MGELSGDFYTWKEENAKKIAEKPGAYALYGDKRVLIYIGSSSNLRVRFLKYWSTNFEEDPCKRATNVYKRVFTSNYKAREKELLDQYHSEHGKLPKCNEKRP